MVLIIGSTHTHTSLFSLKNAYYDHSMSIQLIESIKHNNLNLIKKNKIKSVFDKIKFNQSLLNYIFTLGKLGFSL